MPSGTARTLAGVEHDAGPPRDRRARSAPSRWSSSAMGSIAFIQSNLLVGVGARQRPDDRGHGLGGRPHLRRPLQPGGDARVPRHPAHRAGAGRSLLARPARGRRARRARAARALPERGEPRHGRAGRQPGDQRPPGCRDRGAADVLPRLGHLRHRGRPGRRFQDDLGARDRTHRSRSASSPPARSRARR